MKINYLEEVKSQLESALREEVEVEAEYTANPKITKITAECDGRRAETYVTLEAGVLLGEKIIDVIVWSLLPKLEV